MTAEKSLKAELDNRVKLPGLVNSWGYPIKIRMDMVSTGIRTPVGIKISGDNDLEVIENIALQIEGKVKKYQGHPLRLCGSCDGWEISRNSSLTGVSWRGAILIWAVFQGGHTDGAWWHETVRECAGP